jgi:membrane associated rhomboid family serine protease
VRPGLPPVTKALLAGNLLAFGLQYLFADRVAPFALWPWVWFEPWQLVTYGFLHGDAFHLAFNMLALASFGAPVEQVLGTRRFGLYYFTCLIGAGLVQLAVVTLAMQEGGRPYATVGASGGVFGVLLAFGMMFPHQRVMLLFPPIPMKAWVLVVGYGLVELVMGMTRTQSGVAHFAHLGGMAFGLALLLAWRRPRRR